MRRLLGCSAFVVGSALSASCSDAASGVAWVGDEPHLVAHGTLNGETLDIDVRGADAIAGMITCERQYSAMPLASDPTMPDLTTARFEEVTFDLQLVIGGETRLVEIEVKYHDLQSDPIGTEITVVPRVEGVDPAADEVVFEWEWHTVPGDVTYFEESAQSGTVTLESFTGTPGNGTAVIPEGDGSIGITARVRWSPTESLDISFTAPCQTNDINVE